MKARQLFYITFWCCICSASQWSNKQLLDLDFMSEEWGFNDVKCHMVQKEPINPSVSNKTYPRLSLSKRSCDGFGCRYNVGFKWIQTISESDPNGKNGIPWNWRVGFRDAFHDYGINMGSTYAMKIKLVDWNRDGTQDLAFVTSPSSREAEHFEGYLFNDNGGSRFEIDMMWGFGFPKAIYGDFDGNGETDVAYTGGSDLIYKLSPFGGGGRSTIRSTNFPNCGTAASFTSSTKESIVAFHSNEGSLEMMTYNSGTWSFDYAPFESVNTILSSSSSTCFLQSLDFDLDGYMDIVLASTKLIYIRNQGDGTFQLHEIIEGIDSVIDLQIVNSTKVAILSESAVKYHNQGLPIVTIASGSFSAMSFCDYDADGDMDLVTSGGEAPYSNHVRGGVVRLWKNPHFTTATPTNFPTSSIPTRFPTFSSPTKSPTFSAPSTFPTTDTPTYSPFTSYPSHRPTTSQPSQLPSNKPSEFPTTAPSHTPSYEPSTKTTLAPIAEMSASNASSDETSEIRMVIIVVVIVVVLCILCLALYCMFWQTQLGRKRKDVAEKIRQARYGNHEHSYPDPGHHQSANPEPRYPQSAYSGSRFPQSANPYSQPVHASAPPIYSAQPPAYSRPQTDAPPTYTSVVQLS